MSNVETFNTRPVTAADVRAHFQGDSAALGALSEAAQATVRKGARGRIHPEARSAFNEGRKPSQRYNEGAQRTVEVTFKHVQPSGRKVTKRVMVPEAQARALAGAAAGKRGPLSKAALVAAGEALAAQA